MKYSLVMVWLVNGQIAGQVVQEFTSEKQFSAESKCYRERKAHVSFACVPIPPTPETKP